MVMDISLKPIVKIKPHTIKLALVIWLVFFINVILSSIWTKQLKTPFYASLPERVVINTYAKTARVIYQTFGFQGLEKWLINSSHKEALIFVIDVKNNVILPKKTPIKNAHQLFSYRKIKENDVSYYNNIILGPFIIDTADKKLRIAATRKKLADDYAKVLPATYIRLLYATLSSFLLSYIFIFVFYRKLKTIRNSVIEIKKGNFNCLTKRKNDQGEISLLYNEVYEMSLRIDELIQSKNRLLQDISHEFRSPLARQLTAIEIAKNKLSPDDYQHLIRIENENIKLETLVSELLEYSKTNRSKTLVTSPILLNHLISDIIENTNFEYQTQCISFIAKEEIHYQGDSGLIHRAIENILRNAIKYSGTTFPILVHLYQTKKTIDIEIKDRGPGVKNEDLSLIFEPFLRTKDSNTLSVKGYGLGLSIAKDVFSLHKGKVRARNRKNGGLSIHIELPKSSI